MNPTPPPVSAILSIRVGADLHEEPWDHLNLAETWGDATRNGGVDGGLLLQDTHQRATGAHAACRPDLWDQLDGLLLAWLEALDALAAGATTAVVHFPDTRIECELTALPDDRVAVRYEDIDTTLPRISTQVALRDAAERLIEAIGSGAATPALASLRVRMTKDK